MGPPGHIAVALAAKSAARRAPLWVLIVATEILDLLCFALLAAGIERTGADPSFPWSHGLFMSAVWSAAAGAIALLVYRDRRSAGVLGLLVFSHWVLDYISHAADLPLLFDGSPRVGLGLESSVAVGLVMEFTLLAVGVAIYLVTRRRTWHKTLGP
jgi:membrane-bound metal-dependent hydrolase YbcI (DUF457 family)